MYPEQKGALSPKEIIDACTTHAVMFQIAYMFMYTGWEVAQGGPPVSPNFEPFVLSPGQGLKMD